MGAAHASRYWDRESVEAVINEWWWVSGAGRWALEPERDLRGDVAASACANTSITTHRCTVERLETAAMGKKKKVKTFDAWCWYCDREFEDDKVLLQHQKAKHYRCPHCPRRLNTAGGLTVHLNQVHKAEPTM